MFERNPWLIPMWLFLFAGLATVWMIDIPHHTLWGLLGLIPWLFTGGACIYWDRKHV